MKKWYSLLFAGALLGSVSTLSAQTDAEPLFEQVMLKGGQITTSKNFENQLTTHRVLSSEVFDGKYYRIFQLNAPLSSEAKNAFSAQGIEVLDYVPYQSFIVAIPQKANLRQVQHLVRTMLPLRKADKLSERILRQDFPDEARTSEGIYSVVIKFFDNVNIKNAENELLENGFLPSKKQAEGGALVLEGSRTQILDLADFPFVQFVEFTMPEPTPDDDRARNLHRSNMLFSQSALGRKYDGRGQGIAIADDGFVGPHIDFHGRMIQFYTTNVAAATHGDMTAGIAVGAGNLNPQMRGMASGAHLWAYPISNYPHVYQAVQNRDTRGVYITSTSYSEGCNRYTTTTVFADSQLFNNPTLMHVFSGGNSATSNCGYRGGFGSTDTTSLTGWGNITGGMKLGKNVIACANVTPFDAIDNTSSKGPAFDGRIKPDIAANGNSQMSTGPNNTYAVGGGTSAASPGVAGICAQLYQAHRDLNGGQYPESALIKAALLNSADDLGNVGPDYTFGWGRVNAFRTLRTLEMRRYFSDTIRQGSVKNYTLNVPANTKQVKVMLYWADPAGSTTAAFALVNDLDLTVRRPQGDTILPWVLLRQQKVDSLRKPATRGIDRLNNMEQVQIDTPSVAGDYTLMVRGFSVPNGNAAKFYVVYQFVTDSIIVTSPSGKEGWAQSETLPIRWDAYGDDASGNFTIELSRNDGATWETITTGARGSWRSFDWGIVGAQTGQAKIRVSKTGMVAGVNEDNFSIANLPLNPRIAKICGDSTEIAWDSVAGAAAYEVSRLGQKYMDSLAHTNQTFVRVPISFMDSTWFAVRTILPDGGKSRRTLAFVKRPMILNCALQRDLSATQRLSPTLTEMYSCNTNTGSIPVRAQVQNVGLERIDSFDISYRLNNSTPVTERVRTQLAGGATYTHTFATPINAPQGTHNLTIYAKMNGEQNVLNDTLAAFTFSVGNQRNAPLTEGFDNTAFPPLGWAQRGATLPDTTWERRTVVGINGQQTAAAMFNNFDINLRGGRISLISWLADLRGLTSPKVRFDYAYRQYTTTSRDSLAVLVSADCGNNFRPTTFAKGGLSLASGVPVGTPWFPTMASDWRSDTVSLEAYRDSTVLIAFANIGYFGQNLFLDNINISNIRTNTQDEPLFAPMIGISPNPVENQCQILFKNFDAQRLEIQILDISGRMVRRLERAAVQGDFSERLDVSGLASGMYFVKISTEKREYQLKMNKL